MSNNKGGFHIKQEEQDICSGFLYWLDINPDALALVIDERSYSYQEVYSAALSVYEELKKHKQEKIGVYCENDLYSYAAILAVSMTGACYVPLNSKFPPKKLKDIITDCSLKLIISKNSLLIDFPGVTIVSPSISFDRSEKVHPIVSQPYAYILYTSGTTGMPKGVAVKKKSVNSFFHYFMTAFEFNRDDRFLQAYELSFDVSVFSVFCAWNAGASVFPVKESASKFLEIFKTIGENKITVCSMVPGVLAVVARYFKELNFPFLRYSFFSGDALYHTQAKEWKQCIPNAELHNFYGPTETTIVCTHYKWDEKSSEKESINGIVPLGKAFPEMDFVLTDESGQVMLNEDAQGELCFTGKQVIDSYINNASPESFFEWKNKRYYKTGDWCGINEKNNLVFYGRKDKQVKINGYRVELAEVENAIRNLSSAACKVIAEKKEELNYLVAFVEQTNNKPDLQLELKNILPEYMIPTKFIYVEQLPLTLNNKVDEDQLKTLLNG